MEEKRKALKWVLSQLFPVAKVDEDFWADIEFCDRELAEAYDRWDGRKENAKEFLAAAQDYISRWQEAAGDYRHREETAS